MTTELKNENVAPSETATQFSGEGRLWNTEIRDKIAEGQRAIEQGSEKVAQGMFDGLCFGTVGGSAIGVAAIVGKHFALDSKKPLPNRGFFARWPGRAIIVSLSTLAGAASGIAIALKRNEPTIRDMNSLQDTIDAYTEVANGKAQGKHAEAIEVERKIADAMNMDNSPQR